MFIFFLLLVVIGFFAYKHYNKKQEPEEYVWVGSGENPFK